MSHFKVTERDIYFILKEQLGYGSLCELTGTVTLMLKHWTWSSRKLSSLPKE